MSNDSKRTKQELWPPLSYEAWKDSRDTLHMWMQIVGKTKLQLTPFLNHYWEVAFFVTARGITTGRIPYKDFAFEVTFDFLTHMLIISISDGRQRTFLLKPRTVADFYQEFMQALNELTIQVTISPFASEVKNPIPFEKDTKHASYDKEYVSRWWHIQLHISFLFDRFRTSFRGKSSPVQFFWGSFDLATTRFSGKLLTEKADWPKGYSFMRYAENEENFAIGFWPGDPKFPQAAFYTYIYPVPKGYEKINTGTDISYFHNKISECVLPYEDVRKTKNPEKEIMSFLNTTYKETATLAGWDVKTLEGPVPFKV